jgi:dipeptidyl aminopeptidase/acylaminoacyl peptidase
VAKASIASLLLVLGIAGPSGALPVPMEVGHLALLPRIEEAEVSPDARFVVYTVARPDLARDGWVREVRRIQLPTGGLETIAEGWGARFSPDAKQVALLAPHAGKTAIWLYDWQARTREPLTTFDESARNLGPDADLRLAWAPDGRAIAFLAPEPLPPSVSAPASLFAAPSASAAPVLASPLDLKGLGGSRPLKIWLVATAGPSRGQARPLTAGPGDEHSLAWAPSGERLVFAADRSVSPRAGLREDLWSLDLASGKVERVTAAAGAELAPALSPDGRQLAYRAYARPDNARSHPRELAQLWVQPVGQAGAPAVNLTQSLDRRVRDFAWETPSSLLVLVEDQGRTPLLRLRLGEGGAAPTIERVSEAYAQLSKLSLDAAAKVVVYVKTDMVRPDEIGSTWIRQQRSGQVTQEGRRLLEAAQTSQGDGFFTEVAEGVRVQAWAFRPPGARGRDRFPAVVWVGHGWHGMLGHAYHEAAQLLASHGYGVLLVNPRGAGGYGQAFADGTLNDWGGADLADLLAVVDKALGEFPWIDSARLGIVGEGYGGFLASRALARSERFRVGAAWAAPANLASFAGTTALRDLLDQEWTVPEAERFVTLWLRSPVAAAASVKAPLLLLHGELDPLVPIGQAEELFSELQRRGKPSALARFPGAGHTLERLSQRAELYRRLFGWLDPVLTPPAPPKVPPPEAPPTLPAPAP